MDRFAFTVAAPGDDEGIRGLLRQSVLPGDVQLAFAREPDARIAGRAEGPVHEVIVARERSTGRLAAIASRSVRERFVNGAPVRIGYLAQLRIEPACRHVRSLIDGGFGFCRELNTRTPSALHLASVGRDNAAARRLLETGRPGWPRFTPVDDIETLAIPASTRLPRSAAGIDIVPATEFGAPAVAAFLWQASTQYQFAPCWNADDLSGRLPGLSLADVFVAVRGGAIAGCAALWDQRAFKQVVVRGYAPALRRLRPLVNLCAPFTGLPRLPAPGQALRVGYLSHMAVPGHESSVAVRLVAEATRRARKAGLDHVACGLSAASPLADALRRAFGHRSYFTVLYAVAWPDQPEPAPWPDRRPAQPEIAIL